MNQALQIWVHGQVKTVCDYDKMNIWSVGGLYRFDNNWGLLGQYAVNTESDNSDDKQAYMAELQYKNANIADPGSWGAYVAYRHFGKDVTIVTTYKDVFNNQKGFAIGASYVPVENLLASVKYFDGKDIRLHDSVAYIWTPKLKIK